MSYDDLVYWLKYAVTLILGLLFLWALFSPLAYGLKVALRKLPHWLSLRRLWLLRFRPFRIAQRAFAAVRRKPNEVLAVRLILDERHAHLKRAMANARDAITRASSAVVGLGGTKGPGALVADVNGLQQRIEDYTNFGDEIVIDEEMLAQYRQRSIGYVSGIILLVACGFAAFMNGNLLALFFKGAFNQIAFLGLKVYQLIGIGFVVAEIAFGVTANAAYKKNNKFLFFLMIALTLLAATIEAWVLGVAGTKMHLDIELFDNSDVLKFWMAPLGLIFVGFTSTAGYMLHEYLDDIMSARAARALRREAKALRQLVNDLPGRWDGIRTKAQAAEASIEEFIDALGNKSGTLSGAIDLVKSEREAIVQAMAASSIDKWPEAGEGNAGDARLYQNMSAGMSIGGIVVVVAFVLGTWSLLADAFPQIGLASLFIAAIMSGACLAVGFLAFGRIQTAKEGRTRVLPVRGEAWEIATAAIMAITVVIALFWLAIRFQGVGGIALGLACVAGAGALTFIGYSLERILDGTVNVTNIVGAFAAGFLMLLVALFVHVALWPIFALLIVLLALIRFLAIPWEVLVAMLWRGNSGAATTSAPSLKAKRA